MEQTTHEFLAEAEELIEQILSDLDELRELQHEGRQRRSLIDRVFRRVHSVKGLAAAAEFVVLSKAAHEFESLLDNVRAGRLKLNDSVLHQFEVAADSLSKSLSTTTSQESQSPDPDKKMLSNGVRLDEIASDNQRILSKLPSDVAASLNEDKKHLLFEILNEGSRLFLIDTSFEVASLEDAFEHLNDILRQEGETITTLPTLDATRPDKINLRILYSRSAALEDVVNATAIIPGTSISEVDVTAEGTTFGKGKDKKLSGESGIAHGWTISNFIRTDLEALDHLISSTHELSRATAKILDFARTASTGKVKREIEERDVNIRHSFRALAQEIIQLRLVPVERILKRAARAGYSAARSASKQVNIEIIGGEHRLDKLLADAVADPLVHLVRNAVDHAIEGAAERERSGKAPIGKVSIRFINEGSLNRLKVSDDGRGIDVSAIAKAAIAGGIVDEEVIVDSERALRLIFRPGFSTASFPSTVSGRGVGLDVVETAVEQVGGEIRVSTSPGQGSVFEILLPMTIGLLDSVTVVSSGSRYLIDSKIVVANEPVSIDHCEMTEGLGSVIWKNETLPLVFLCTLLGQTVTSIASSKPVNVLVCQLSDERDEKQKIVKRIGVVVDGIEGSNEVLVRSLGRHAARWPGIAGATELSDGSIALVIDLPRLLSTYL